MDNNPKSIIDSALKKSFSGREILITETLTRKEIKGKIENAMMLTNLEKGSVFLAFNIGDTLEPANNVVFWRLNKPYPQDAWLGCHIDQDECITGVDAAHLVVRVTFKLLDKQEDSRSQFLKMSFLNVNHD